MYTWGKGDYYRLGHGTDQHIRWPTLVEGLRGKKVTGISVGALHCLAVTDAGQVLAWGDNDHGQQGNGGTTVNRRPTLVHGFEGVKITRIACGSSHSVAWTAPEPPTCAPPEPVPFPTTKDPLGSTAAGNSISSSNSCRIYFNFTNRFRRVRKDFLDNLQGLLGFSRIFMDSLGSHLNF